jgi:hypothetical protein
MAEMFKELGVFFKEDIGDIDLRTYPTENGIDYEFTPVRDDSYIRQDTRNYSKRIFKDSPNTLKETLAFLRNNGFISYDRNYGEVEAGIIRYYRNYAGFLHIYV